MGRDGNCNAGLTGLDGFNPRARVGRDAISIVDESVVPEKFHRVKIEIDKLAIRDALKNGEEVPGIELQRGEALVIR